MKLIYRCVRKIFTHNMCASQSHPFHWLCHRECRVRCFCFPPPQTNASITLLNEDFIWTDPTISIQFHVKRTSAGERYWSCCMNELTNLFATHAHKRRRERISRTHSSFAKLSDHHHRVYDKSGGGCNGAASVLNFNDDNARMAGVRQTLFFKW